MVALSPSGFSSSAPNLASALITEVDDLNLSPSDIQSLVKNTGNLTNFLIAGSDYGWVDNTGAIAGVPIYGFLLSTSDDPIIGRCLVTAVDGQGKTQSAQISASDLTSDVTWLPQLTPSIIWNKNESGEIQAVVGFEVKKTGGAAMTLPARFQGTGHYTILKA